VWRIIDLAAGGEPARQQVALLLVDLCLKAGQQ